MATRGLAGALNLPRMSRDICADTVVAVEVKMSTEMPMNIHANLRQLYTAIFLQPWKTDT